MGGNDVILGGDGDDPYLDGGNGNGHIKGGNGDDGNGRPGSTIVGPEVTAEDGGNATPNGSGGHGGSASRGEVIGGAGGSSGLLGGPDNDVIIGGSGHDGTEGARGIVYVGSDAIGEAAGASFGDNQGGIGGSATADGNERGEVGTGGLFGEDGNDTLTVVDGFGSISLVDSGMHQDVYSAEEDDLILNCQ